MSQLQRITIHPSQLQETFIILTPKQKHYLLRVLRLGDGDKFIAMDGMGKWWLAQLTAEIAQVLELLEVKTELPISITLMMALPKGNGFDDIVRYCTELGVTCIAPVISDRTLLKPSPQKLERWQRIATEAAEQSERAFVPTILEPVTFKTAINECQINHRYICEARGEYPHLTKVINHSSSEIIIAIGPEGGWSDSELEIAIKSEFQPVSLGRRILRAVTAPVVALSLIAAICEV
ncbi:16S rRNA (uracil(1498)-N(3))-methyltransferase [Okeanomitos corallinicola TIOX110]|uniref:Ribosomal RNA small subunit methyltransferase E n=1 Tax=Okeanomitos corallinicola TIOX110 TaxID=3133117 RepID=A0ABZ2UMZ7_9CYAN